MSDISAIALRQTVLRPLSQGIRSARDVSEGDKRFFSDIKNFRVEPYGLQGRGGMFGFTPTYLNDIPYIGIQNYLRSMFLFQKGLSTQQLIAVSSNFFYKVDTDANGIILDRQSLLTGSAYPIVIDTLVSSATPTSPTLLETDHQFYIYSDSAIQGASQAVPGDALVCFDARNIPLLYGKNNDANVLLMEQAYTQSRVPAGVVGGSIYGGPTSDWVNLTNTGIFGLQIAAVATGSWTVGGLSYSIRFLVNDTQDINGNWILGNLTTLGTLQITGYSAVLEPVIQASVDPTLGAALRYPMLTQYCEMKQSPSSTISNLYWVNGLRVKMGRVNGSFNVGNYDDLTLNVLGTNMTIENINCVASHGGYLWIANFTERDTVTPANTQVLPTRIRWSSPTDAQIMGYGSGSFFDLPTTAPVLRIVPFGQSLFVFTTSEIFIGVPSSLTGLPYRFVKQDIGGIALGGSEAYAIGGNILFLISKQGFSAITENGQIKDLSENLDIDTRSIKYARVWASPEENRVYFYLPSSTDTDGSDGTLWVFNGRTSEFSTWNLGDTKIVGGSWTSVGVDQDFTNGLSVRSYTNNFLLFTADTPSQIFIHDPKRQYSPAIAGEEWSIETFDFDGGAADMYKVWARLHIRMRNALDVDALFQVYASVDQGYTWRDLGPLNILAGAIENRKVFSITSATVRFRIVLNNQGTVTDMEPLVIQDIGYAARIGGQQSFF